MIIKSKKSADTDYNNNYGFFIFNYINILPEI